MSLLPNESSCLAWLFLVAVCGCLLAPAAVQAQDEVADLLKLLDNTDSAVRASGLVLMSELAKNIRTRDRDKAEAILKDLRKAGPQIAKHTEDPSAQVREAAVEALGQTRAAGAVAGPAWAKTIKDPEPRVRVATAEAISHYLTRTAYEHGKSTNAIERLTFLEEQVTDAAAFPLVLEVGWFDSRPEVRAASLQTAIQLYSSLINLPPIITPTLLTPEAQKEAEDLIAKLKKGTGELAKSLGASAPVLGLVLRQGEVPDQVSAGQALEELARFWSVRLPQPDLDPDGKKAAEVLLKGLKDALRYLAQGVGDPTYDVQLAAVQALEMFGPEAESARAALVRALYDEDRFVRWAASRSLSKIGPSDDPATLQGLIHLLDDDDSDVRVAGALALESFGPKAAPAVTALVTRARQFGYVDLALAALRALNKIGADAISKEPETMKLVIDGLAGALERNRDVRIRRQVPPLLASFGDNAKPAVPALRDALQDPDIETREAAAKALIKILSP